MQFEKCQQLALRLGEFAFRKTHHLNPQSIGGGAQRITIRLDILNVEEALFLEGLQNALGIVELRLQRTLRHRPRFQQPQDFNRRVIVRCPQQKLTRRVAAGVGQRVLFPFSSFAGQWSH